MQTKFSLFALLLGASLSLFTSSCGLDDPCKDVECGANGSCFEGECVCNEGFEGISCAEEWGAKFLGSYTGQDVCVGENNGTFRLKTPAIVTRVDGTTVSISNFGGFESVLRAKVKKKAADSVSATELDLTYTDPAQRKFVGTATLNGSTLSGNYTVTYVDGKSDRCTFTYTR